MCVVICVCKSSGVFDVCGLWVGSKLPKDWWTSLNCQNSTLLKMSWRAIAPPENKSPPQTPKILQLQQHWGEFLSPGNETVRGRSESRSFRLNLHSHTHTQCCVTGLALFGTKYTALPHLVKKYMDAIKRDDWLPVRITHALANRKQIDVNGCVCTFNFSLITRNMTVGFFLSRKRVRVMKT